MGGSATFSGTTYQGRVIALVYVHILAQMRLGWFTPADDTPVAISGETDGPGDDALIDFDSKLAAAEIQAKHGLSGGSELENVLDRIRTKSPSGEVAVVIVVDRVRSSRWLYTDLPHDLSRLRSGRTDGLKASTNRFLRDHCGGDVSDLRSVYVVPIDVDLASEPEAKHALQLLQTVILADATQTAAAWATLTADASDLCARRERRTRNRLVDLLEGAGIKVRPPARDDAWHRKLDFTKELLRRRQPKLALELLTQIEGDLAAHKGPARVEPFVRYRIAQQRAAALVHLGRATEALASACRALEIDPTGVHALTVASFAAAVAGDVDAALRHAEKATERHPVDPQAWGALAQARDKRGERLPNPPASVAESVHYRMILMQIAVDRHNAPELLRLSAELLAEGERDPLVLFQRANSLIQLSDFSTGMGERERLNEVERLTTEIIDEVHRISGSILVKAYVLRSGARRRLGRPTEAHEDLSAAKELEADDLDALHQEANGRAESGDYVGALNVLLHPAVASAPELLAMRAKLEVITDNASAARRDIDAALEKLGEASDPEGVRFITADAALHLPDATLANQILDSVSSENQSEARFRVLRGRLAFARGLLDEGTALYRGVAADDLENRTELLAELGAQLFRAQRFADSVGVYLEIEHGKFPRKALLGFTASLLAAGDLVKAQALIDELAVEGPLPVWALAAATDIALQQEDTEQAIAHLVAIVERGGGRSSTRLELARLLVDAGRIHDAMPHIEHVRRLDGLSPFERMQTAQLMHAVGQHNEAIPIAHQAFLDAPGDPGLHRAFIMMTLLGKGDPPHASVAGAGTYVRLKRAEGNEIEYTIVDAGEVDPRRNELSLVDATTIGLQGLRVGDTLVRYPGSWQEETWTLEQVLPMALRDAQDAALRYEERFPSEPFFLKSFAVGDGTSIKAFAPIIASLESQRQRAQSVFASYRDNRFPLGVIAKLLGHGLSEAMEHIIVEGETIGPLLVEWPHLAAEIRSGETAVLATEIVLTRSALRTVDRLGLLDLLSQQFRLFAPRSMADELRLELAEADERVREGHRMIMSTGVLLHIDELAPDDPRLVRRRDIIRNLVNFVGDRVDLEPRPLHSVIPGDSSENSLREMVGRSSFDALVLSKHRNAPVFADDLWLRSVEIHGHRTPSFSTLSLLGMLVGREALASGERDQHLIALAVECYAFILPTRQLLGAALHRFGELGESGIRRVFVTLAHPGIEPEDAASILVQVVRDQVLSPVQTITLERIIALGFEAMATRWRPGACRDAIVRSASIDFQYLPQVVDEIRHAAQDLARKLTLRDASIRGA